MKVSGAVAMADNLEAFGMTEFGGKVGGGMEESMVDRIAAVLRSRVDVSCPDDRCMCDQGDVRWSCILGISPIQLAIAIDAALKETK